MFGSARLLVCLFSLSAVDCDAAADVVSAGLTRTTSTRQSNSPMLPPAAEARFLEVQEAVLRSASPASPGPMQKNGSDGSPSRARLKPIGTIDLAAEGNLQRPDHPQWSRIVWVRTTHSTLHLRHILLQI